MTTIRRARRSTKVFEAKAARTDQCEWLACHAWMRRGQLGFRAMAAATSQRAYRPRYHMSGRGNAGFAARGRARAGLRMARRATRHSALLLLAGSAAIAAKLSISVSCARSAERALALMAHEGRRIRLDIRRIICFLCFKSDRNSRGGG